ncbi:MAG: DUF1792 domain-containing protein [Clostridia bacterium]|nr:DUF1792 domain-containing protein [Clostridia bacterium]
MKSLLLKIWNFLYDARKSLAERFWYVFDFFYRSFTTCPKVAGVEETVCAIRDHGYSFARFGDGEIKLVAGKDISFQVATPLAVRKLRETLHSDDDGLLIGVADIFGDRSRYTDSANRYWKKHLSRYRRVWYKYLRRDKRYYNASVTRQYITLRDPSESEKIFSLFKQVWHDRDVVLIEGEKSRLGIGNDLLDGARSVRRILGPAAQAFSEYDKLLETACTLEKDVLFLIALGPCATALARDLHLRGYQAVDVGHIDVEYEWMKMGAKSRTPLKNKLVYEAGGAVIGDVSDTRYTSQIIARIV